MKVLMVCTGNICRSPMAVGLMRHRLGRTGCDDVEVVSAGTAALQSSPASGHAVKVLLERGIDLSAHRSTPLTRAALESSDLVVAMAAEHVAEITALDPEATSKTILLKELGEMQVSAAAEGAPRAERLRVLLGAARAERNAGLDVADPIGRSARAYEATARDISAGIDVLVDVLCGGG